MPTKNDEKEYEESLARLTKPELFGILNSIDRNRFPKRYDLALSAFKAANEKKFNPELYESEITKSNLKDKEIGFSGSAYGIGILLLFAAVVIGHAASANRPNIGVFGVILLMIMLIAGILLLVSSGSVRLGSSAIIRVELFKRYEIPVKSIDKIEIDKASGMMSIYLKDVDFPVNFSLAKTGFAKQIHRELIDFINAIHAFNNSESPATRNCENGPKNP